MSKVRMKRQNWWTWLELLMMNVDTNDAKSFHTLEVNLKVTRIYLLRLLRNRYENISFKESPTSMENQRQSGIDNASMSSCSCVQVEPRKAAHHKLLINTSSPSVKQTKTTSPCLPPLALTHPTPSTAPPLPLSTCSTDCFAHFSFAEGR